MVNHAYAKGGERIEVFDIRVDNNDIPYRLDYKYSITSDFLNDHLMGVINSLVVVDKNKFYITKFMDAHNVDGTFEMPTISSTLFPKDRLPVYFCDYTSGKLECEVAADNFRGPNGITHNKDYTLIFVNGGNKNIRVF